GAVLEVVVRARVAEHEVRRPGVENDGVELEELSPAGPGDAVFGHRAASGIELFLGDADRALGRRRVNLKVRQAARGGRSTRTAVVAWIMPSVVSRIVVAVVPILIMPGIVAARAV